MLGCIEQGSVFGELAVLYNCTRTASVHAESDVTMLCLDRRVFQAIMMKTGLQRRHQNLTFLKRSRVLRMHFQCTLKSTFLHFHFSVPLLKSLNDEKLSKLADVLEVVRVKPRI